MILRVKITLVEEMLGMSPANPDLYRDFIESRRQRKEGEPENTEETDALPTDEQVEKGTTVFPRLPDGRPGVWDYQIKGMFKDSCGALKRASSEEFISPKLKAHKKEIDGLVFVAPRLIPLCLPPGAEIGYCTRPLRASTAQGERVSLARSETVPAGTVMEFDVALLNNKLEDYVREWLDYGALRGLGQWRNSGKGRYLHTIEVVPPAVKTDRPKKSAKEKKATAENSDE